jgi:large subunit ribosomal protein L18
MVRKRGRVFAFSAATSIFTRKLSMIRREHTGIAVPRDVEAKSEVKNGGKYCREAVGKIVAKRAIDKSISAVLFDRGGYIYRSRVKALADAA